MRGRQVSQFCHRRGLETRTPNNFGKLSSSVVYIHKKRLRKEETGRERVDIPMCQLSGGGKIAFLHSWNKLSPLDGCVTEDISGHCSFYFRSGVEQTFSWKCCGGCSSPLFFPAACLILCTVIENTECEKGNTQEKEQRDRVFIAESHPSPQLFFWRLLNWPLHRYWSYRFFLPIVVRGQKNSWIARTLCPSFVAKSLVSVQTVDAL